jgi:hypothetical protein
MLPAVIRSRRTRAKPPVCDKTPDVAVGTAFVSECAPTPASAVEARLSADVFGRLALTPGLNAVRVQRPFFQHFEVWPDLVLNELRVAIEYDSTGRHGLEHVGKREEADRGKDRALRAAGWEVIRLRTGKLERLGPHDIQLKAWDLKGLDGLVDALCAVRVRCLWTPTCGDSPARRVSSTALGLRQACVALIDPRAAIVAVVVVMFAMLVSA